MIGESVDLLDGSGRRNRAPDDPMPAQLERILACPRFSGTERSKALLRFLIEETLAGRAGRLKQYTIATGVFGRGETFDPTHDPVVRSEAAKLRKALDLYYLTEGRGDPVVIEIPKGGYAPEVRRRGEETPDRPQPSPDPTGERRSGIPTIAVLPLRNAVDSPEADAFATGLTEELIVALTRFEDLRVIGHHSVLGVDPAHPNMVSNGDGLGVDFALLGGVR